jgi:hypothetical protein
VSSAGKLDSDITAKKKEIADTQTEVESIVAGQAERKNWIAMDRFINESVPVPGPIGKNPVIPGYHNMLDPQQLKYWNTTNGQRAIAKLHDRVARGVDPVQDAGEDDFREFLATVDIEAVTSRFTKDLKGVYTRLEERGRQEFHGATGRAFPGSDLAPEDWWTSKTAPPASEKEELKPDGEGWVFEIRGYTYWKPDSKTLTNDFITNTLLRNIIARSRGLTEEQKKNLKPEDQKAWADDPIRGKLTHAFLYGTWDDKTPSPGSFKVISGSLIYGLIPDDTGGGGGGMGGMGEGRENYGPPSGPGGGPRLGGGKPGSIAGAGSPGAAGSGGGWSPLGSAFGSGTAGGSGAGGPMMGMSGMGPGAGPAIGMIPSHGPGGGPGPGTVPTPGGGEPAKGTVKVKPRYEFIIVFTWKEPTPSDKLRPIKVAEKAAAAAGVGSPAPGPAAGRGSPSPSPSSGSSGDSEGGGLNIRGGLKDD